jgi:hypothetical protein
MTTTTLNLPVSMPAAKAAPAKPAAAPAKGFWRCFFEALMEARMRAALREIDMHRHLVPHDVLKAAGYTPTAADDGAMPFTRER